MATATKHVTKPVDPPYTVTLELTQDEAEVLMFLTGRICGSASGPRGDMSDIYYALGQANVQFPANVYLPAGTVALESSRG